VDTIFGLPGDGINAIMEALRIRQDSVRFIQIRHEEGQALLNLPLIFLLAQVFINGLLVAFGCAGCSAWVARLALFVL
jgi:glyoxylate carboligase